MMVDLDKKIFMNAYEGKIDNVIELTTMNENYLILKDMNKRLLIHWAAVGGHEALVLYLLNKNQPINAKDDIGMTPLILAASAGRTAVVKILIQRGADVNLRNDGGHSALQYAASKGWTEIVALLINNGADVNVQDNDGATPLHRASSKGNTPVVSLLLICESDININAVDGYGNTPLHLACEEDRLEIVELLSRHGALNTILNKEEKTPLDLASPKILSFFTKLNSSN